MRSDGGESAGRGTAAGRREWVVSRWVSVKTVAAKWEVSRSFVVRFEAADGFGAGNSRVLRLPGSTGPGELRIRASAVNRAAEAEVARRELERARAAAATVRQREVAR